MNQNQSPFAAMQNPSYTGSKSKSNRASKFIKFIASIKTLAVIVIVFQVAILYFQIRPINVLNELNAVQVINKVSRLTTIPSDQLPTAIGRVGDNTLLPDVDTLIKGNDIQAQVYKDAKDADYVIVYTDRMVIFRESENRVIYDGFTPAKILSNNQDELVKNLLAKVKEQGIISKDNDEAPQLRIITTELADLQRTNGDFYSQAKENDIIAMFAKENKIVLYRAEGNAVIKYGDMSIR